MATLKKYDLSGQEVGEVQVADDLLTTSVNSQMMKDYLVAIRANQRQWSANTRGRSEVNHSNAKPHPQKGTGRARQGTLSAPQYKGGGTVFGPKPKSDQHVRINRKERRATIRYLISEKIRQGKLCVLDQFELKGPKTKTIAQFLSKLGVDGQRVLFLGESFIDTQDADKALHAIEKQTMVVRSLNNIPKVGFAYARNVSGYDMAYEGHVVVLGEAMQDIMLMLGA